MTTYKLVKSSQGDTAELYDTFRVLGWFTGYNFTDAYYFASITWSPHHRKNQVVTRWSRCVGDEEGKLRNITYQSRPYTARWINQNLQLLHRSKAPIIKTVLPKFITATRIKTNKRGTKRTIHIKLNDYHET